MSLLRKFMGPSRQLGPETPQPSNQDNALGLMHLRKLFAEFRHPTGASQRELEDRLYNMLPLFCKVFGTAPSSDMTEKFGDILQFCSHVSRLMVSEVRRRASNQSTEKASLEIVKFLEIDSTEEASNGWMLLSTINLLSTGAPSLIDCMTAASLPSTLVKCLYLFFDLPEVENADVLEPGHEFTPRERRILLQKVFSQVLVRLCSHVSPAEELARKDDLILLFQAITSWCPMHNVPWRKSAAEVLMTLSRHGLTPNVVQYIHSKGCVSQCIENMHRMQELSPIELVEMFVTVFCFLKDSSDVSQMLMDDFRTCQGYVFLSEFLLKMEHDESEEAIQALRNLVLLVGSLTTCGFIELKPGSASAGSLFQMPGFSIPQPAGKGVSVRNIQAFQVLQTVFLKSTSPHLCSTILDVISSIYHQDNANYFILEPQNTLSQFAERVHSKTAEIQSKYLELLEFVIFNLNYVPCKELISLSLLIKANHSIDCSILCMKTLLRVLQYHAIYKDVFREVGLLEVFVTCLHRYAALLKEPQEGQEPESLPDTQAEMGRLTMDTISLLLSGNSSNAGVFRECGGARCAHNMVPFTVCRNQTLTMVQQLVLSNGGDDDMGTLLGFMHTAPVSALELKTHVLKALLHVLKESHRTRTVFRKVNGFLYVMSVLVSMEGCLADPPKAPWDKAEKSDIVTLLRTVFSTMTVAMRYEPANAKFFATDVRYASLTEAVRLLGCFSTDVDVQRAPRNLKPWEDNIFSDFFYTLKEDRWPNELPRSMMYACMMLRFLYDTALDYFEKPIQNHMDPDITVLRHSSSNLETIQQDSCSTPVRPNVSNLSLTLNSTQQEAVIVHAGAVVSMLHLVPAIACEENTQLALDLQFFTCEVIKSLVRSERNQQVMCESGLPHELLTHCNITLADENHPLHPPIQYMFERLAAQALTPKDLRDFLRLGGPLCSSAEDAALPYLGTRGSPDGGVDKPANMERRTPNDIKKKLCTNGGAVPLTRVKCLVSMTTPRDVRLHGSTITPGFVEFDMNAEGFGCLYLPSIAPQGPPNPSVVGAGMIGGSDLAVVGGIGSGERLFPPPSGITFSSWFCIDKFSSGKGDAHPVRLLSLVRNIQGKEENLICLSVYLTPRDRALIVSTQETRMPSGNGHEPEHEPVLGDTTVRFWCPELTQEGQWRHLVLVFHRAGIMKNSSVSIYVDGQQVSTEKLHYISPNLGTGGTASASAATSVFSYIGTPPPLRRVSRLTWRQGPCHLIEDALPTVSVLMIYNLGPNYVGNFQAPVVEKDLTGSLVPEDKVMFGVHAHAISLMTVAKIRKVFNKVDAKSIAKQLGMSAHENATPIRILHNSADCLSGPARSFGAIVMGYLGVRIFCPKPVSKMLMNVGGTSTLLGLIAMATDVEGLYAAVKALVCVVRSNRAAQREMDRTKGYQTLAVLFKKKRHLLNSHILHLTFSLVGTVDSGRETTIIPNRDAFEDLLCDLDVWHEAPADLQRSLYEHFFELLTESRIKTCKKLVVPSEQKTNLQLMLDIGLVVRLLHVLKDPQLSKLTVHVVASVLTVLLSGANHHTSVLRFGQFLVSTLPSVSSSEKHLKLCDRPDGDGKASNTENSGLMSPVCIHNVQLRNICLDILLKLLTTQPLTNGVNSHVCEELQKTLGFDWLLLFMQGHLHPSTVVSAMRVLLLMLSSPGALQKFRDGTQGGGWLDETESVLQNRIGVLLGFNVGTGNSSKAQNRELNMEVCHMPGFISLQWLLPKHAEIPELYFLLMALLLGQQVKDLPSNIHFDLDSVWTFIYGVPASQPASLFNRHKTELCAEAATVILSMVRAVLNQSTDDVREGTWLQEYPVTLMQFLLFLYHNQADFLHMCLSADFLSALVATLFPYRITSESSSELNSPVEDFKPFPGSEAMVLVSTPEKATASSLTTHPARKFVMDFLRMIVVDSLSLPQSSKTAPVIDLLLDSSPEHASRRQRREFQTELLKLLMDHLLAADALLGEQAALPITPGGNYTHLANNIFYLAGRVVDKLWQGFYTGDPKEVFEFISKLISQAKRRGMSLDGMYRCLNRTVLYQLSRPMYSVSHQMTVLDALHKLTSNRSLVFGPGNYDLDFIGCLCHCLLLLTDNPASLSDTPAVRTTVWHVDPEDEEEEQAAALAAGSSGGKEGFRLISNAAKRVWEELYVCKKPAIEEACKVTLTFTDPATSPKITTPDLHTVRNLIQEPVSRAWVTYFENEQKCNYSQAQLQSQLQSRLQRVGHGVLRLASRKSKRDQPVKPSPASVQDYSSWTLTHVSIVRDLVEIQHQQLKQSQHHMEKFLLEEWSVTETELMRERGLWGPPTGSELDKWSLDHTEGPSRMRKKMIRNDLFYIHYPYRPDHENDKPQKYKVAISFDSRKYFERYRAHSLVGEETLPHSQSQSSDLGKDEVDSEPQTPENLLEMPTNIPSLLPRIKRETSSNQVAGMENDDDVDYDPGAADVSGTTEGASEGEPNQVQSGDYQSVIRLLEEGEQISHMFRCARVQGLDNAEGLLLFGKYHFYVVDGFTLLKTKDISDIESLSPEHHEPIIPKSCVGSNRPPKRMCGKFCYEDIKEVHKRRYLLQPTALEVFSADGRTLLLVFPRKIRNKVYTRFITVATALADTAQESVSGQRQNAKVEAGTGLISSLMGEKSVTQRWERGEISNFEYLMCLNTLAGRSYNDLMQYPVFPWILADYESEELDLSDEKSFRDLSKPMGAQTPDRLKQFKKRYSDWEDPQGETPPYHYGTHYSSAMIVASYLVRMEPFTQHFLRLQGGHFDLADRMFHSVKDGWMSASKHNMADVKELIPEFFYLPEFLLNSNHFDLGTKQSGVSLNDVVLPVWAKGDPREFIRVHREALECDYVSAHLNEWIDLIFGYKQQGPLAVDAVNVFHHLFYEGNVDINSIDDPLKKNAIVGFINNFGQIPSQLFKKPHPQKKLSLRNLDPMPMGSLVNGTNDKVFFHHVDNLKPSMQPIKELKHPVGQIVHSDKAILAVPQNQVLVPPQYNKYLAWGFPDLTLKMGNYDSDKASCVFENLDNGEILCASCPSAKLVITAGTSTVVNVWEVSKKKDRKALTLKKPLYGHTEPVTCLASSITYNIIVSGSRDRTCIVWDLGMLCFLRQLQGHAAPVAAVAINDLTGDIATCAGTYLHLWSINGDEVASINTATGRNQQILCVAMSQMMEWDPQNVILTGNNDGVVRMWSVEFVEVPDETQAKQEKNKTGETAKVEQRPQTLSEPHNIPNIHRLCSLEDTISETTADTVQDYRDNDMLGVQVEAELGSSVESGGTLTEAMKSSEKSNQGVVEGDLISFDSPVQEHPPQRQISNLSSVSGSDFTGEGPPAATYRQPERTEPDGAALSVGRDQSSQGPESQREPGSPTSDFEMVSDKEVKAAMKSLEDVLQIQKGQKNKLRPGFKWQRQLVFRSKLTMHTAFERRDNNAPAPVTSLAISKDHKTVYVGDGKCRVFSWSVTDQPGRVIADHWVKDEGGDSCNNCNVKFTFSERRHHCRNCGQLYCSKCSRFETEIHRLRIMKPVRVCQTCFSKLKVEQANAEKSSRSSVKV